MATMKEDELRQLLGDHWDQEMGATEGGEESPFPVESGMDSVSAVHVLGKLMKHIDGEKIPLTVIRKGGYQNKDDFVTTLCASLITHFSDTEKK